MTGIRPYNIARIQPSKRTVSLINSWRVIFKQDRGRSEEITWKSSEEVLVATSLPICRLLSYPVQVLKMHCSLRLAVGSNIRAFVYEKGLTYNY